jgi:hypothetical protein
MAFSSGRPRCEPCGGIGRHCQSERARTCIALCAPFRETLPRPDAVGPHRHARRHRQSRGLSRLGRFRLADRRNHPRIRRTAITYYPITQETPMPAFMVFIREKTVDQIGVRSLLGQNPREIGRSPDQNPHRLREACDAGRAGSRGRGYCRVPLYRRRPRLVRQPCLSGSRATPISRGCLSRPDCRRNLT